MDCPACSGPTKVIDSRPRPNKSVRRRRECENCGRRFSTTERKVAEQVPVRQRLLA